MLDKRLKVSVIGGASVAIDDLDKLPALPSLDIHVEKAEFRDVMSITAVASELGRSVRQVRRLISTGAFPEGCVRQGQKQFWLQATVREWQKSHLADAAEHRAKRKGRFTRWTNERAIEKDEDRRSARLHPDTEKLLIDVREMKSLLATDPAEFARRHPNLKGWLKDKGTR